MDSPILIVVLLFALVAVAALVAAWWYARRIKQNLDAAPPPAAGSRGALQLTSGSVEQLRQLTPEPILMKQSSEGVRVQIEQRPMLPMMAFAGSQASGALSETAAAVTERYGLKWVVLVSPGEDGRVVVQRLA